MGVVALGSEYEHAADVDDLAAVGLREPGRVERLGGGPNATTRPASRQTRSQRALAHARSWLETTTVRPSARRRPRMSENAASVGASAPEQRLVQEQQVGLLHERAREQHPLPLAAGELSDLAAGVLLHPHRASAVRARSRSSCDGRRSQPARR